MEGISITNDVKRNKGHLCRCVVRWEEIILMISILFLALDSMENLHLSVKSQNST